MCIRDRHKLVIDEVAAVVVREIFRLRLSGFSGKKIASILNERAIPSPAQYALNHKRGMDWRRVNQKTAWDPTKVIAILKDERYAGNMVSLRRTLKMCIRDRPITVCPGFPATSSRFFSV